MVQKFSTYKAFQTQFPEPIIPDLTGLQYGSFQNFLLNGLPNVLKKNNPLSCQYGSHYLTLEFFPERIQFRKPDTNPNSSLFFGKTYGCSIYIPVLIRSTEWHELKIEWISLGYLPLMTKAGHFIINGIPRVVLHQLVRNPGVYILLDDPRTKLPTVRIVPEYGSWINITIDSKSKVWFTTRLLRRKISILIILQALGVSFDEILTRIKHASFLTESFISSSHSNEKTRQNRILKRANLTSHPITQSEAYRYIYAHVQEYTPVSREQLITDENSFEFFNKIIWNPSNRQLNQLGREQFREKLNSSSDKSQLFLTEDDLLQATQALLELKAGERESDDIDSLDNKRINGCGEFLAESCEKGLRDFELTLTRKLNLSGANSETIWKLQKPNLSKIISKSWKTFFTSGTLSQFLDETNPLSEATHKRRITVLGPGGVSGKQTTIQIRGIHPTYYGRLCPIETPEGQNAGLVNSLTVFTRPNKLGSLETPLYHVYKGQVQKFLSPVYFRPYDEFSSILAPSDIMVNSISRFSSKYLPVRKNWNFQYSLWNEITNQSIGILQMISIATSLIPFLEHNDANRALMGSNMQRQAVPLLCPEVAFVQTGLESRVVSDIHHSLHSTRPHYVTAVSAQAIRFYKPKPSLSLCLKNAFHNALFTTTKKKESKLNYYTVQSEIDFYNNSLLPPNWSIKNQAVKNITTKFLDIYFRTNQSTCKIHRPVVQEREWIEKSDVIADGAASSGGKLALGKNILVAYMPWEGFNFEDAIVISDRLVRQNLFTSLHLDYYETEVRNTQYGLETITNSVPVEVTDSDRDVLRIKRLQGNGIIGIGTYVTEGDYLVGKITPMNPKGPSVQQQYEKLYNVIMQRENIHVRNTSLRVPKGVEGFVFSVDILPPKEPDVIAIAPKETILRVRISLLQYRKIQVGDKMAGRHGNKGIVSKILPEYDMPFLPDGTPIDILLNPLGVPSRMNVGQILECLLGLASYYLNEVYTIQLFDEKSGPESSRSFVYSKLLEASIKTHNLWLFEPHHPGKMKIFDGRTGLPFSQPVTVGWTYMLKLVHLVDDKLHARATGPYSAITQQPVRGRSRNGGQRLGEMEVWALQAYGAATILQELLTVKSDDVNGRKQAVFQIYTNKPIEFGPPESFRVLIRELQALCFRFRIFTRYPKTGRYRQIFNF